jgi:nitric oxide reductase subunit B
MHFFGAGVWGFAHSLPQINQWTHGTQFTSSHAHFAFYGAYVMLNLSVIYFALPKIKGIEIPDQKLGIRTFWIINFFMIMVVFSFTTAGIVQAYIQRIMGMDYITTQSFLKLWFTVLWVSGWGLTVGVILYLLDFFSLKPRPVEERSVS